MSSIRRKLLVMNYDTLQVELLICKLSSGSGHHWIPYTPMMSANTAIMNATGSGSPLKYNDRMYLARKLSSLPQSSNHAQMNHATQSQFIFVPAHKNECGNLTTDFTSRNLVSNQLAHYQLFCDALSEALIGLNPLKYHMLTINSLEV